MPLFSSLNFFFFKKILFFLILFIDNITLIPYPGIKDWAKIPDSYPNSMYLDPLCPICQAALKIQYSGLVTMDGGRQDGPRSAEEGSWNSIWACS